MAESAVSVMPWKGAFPPFRIFGNLYFVGTQPASTHIVDTGAGLILFDSGYQHSLYLVIDGMHRLGLDPHDLKYIFHTHGHIDHFGGTRALVELTGAKTAIGRPDAPVCTGESDLSYAKELHMTFAETFTPDILLDDGDQITLGRTTVTCKATPGHTAGAMSFFFDVTDGEKTYRAGLHGGMGINTMCGEYLDRYHLPYDCRQKFKDAMDRLAAERVDIFLGNHMQHNHTPRRYGQILAGDREAFVRPGEWGEFARWAKENLIRMEREEADARPKTNGGSVCAF